MSLEDIKKQESVANFLETQLSELKSAQKKRKIDELNQKENEEKAQEQQALQQLENQINNL